MFNFSLSDRFYSFLFVICSFVISAHSDVPRPRGVSLAKASLYSPTKDFTCFDGTGTIPFSYVNDDYCDCFDGSDEPGTSACLNAVFHCTNAGHRAQNIPSSRVNDGVCDCCDGTDEYASEADCYDTCEDLGKEARAEAQRKAELYKEGSQLRQDYINRGVKARNEMAEQLIQLEKDKLEAEKIKLEKENFKNMLENREREALQVYRDAEERERENKAKEENEASRKEAEITFNTFDSDSDGHLTIDEMLPRSVFDKDRNGEVTAEEIKEFIGDHDHIDLETFVTETWPILKPFLMVNEGLFQPASSTEEEQSEIDTETDDKEIDEQEDIEHEDDQPGEDLDDVEPLEPKQHQQYDEETQHLVDAATNARHEFATAERSVREIESNIKDIKEKLDKDYGLHHEFATLDSMCYEYQDKEYIYELCPFQKVTQKSKNGGQEIGLGKWGEWSEGDDKYALMKYTNGVGCWNGPNRSTVVYVQCGIESKIVSVTEPYRCEYRMEFITPCACDESKITKQTSHDEL